MFIGAEIGYDFPAIGDQLNVFSKIFIKLIKCVIARHSFSVRWLLASQDISNIRQVGRMGWKSLLYFEVVTTVALGIGLLAINISRAGAGINAGKQWRIAAYRNQTGRMEGSGLHVFPTIWLNPFRRTGWLIVVFTLSLRSPWCLWAKQRRPFLTLPKSVRHHVFRFTDIIMKLAPLAVGEFIAYTVSHLGWKSCVIWCYC